MLWVKVVEAVVDAVAAEAAAVEVDQVGWVAPSPLGQAATASAPTVGIGSRTWLGNRATRKSVPSAVPR